jgi:glycerol-3-phosphate O-acyltransferase 3/4
MKHLFLLMTSWAVVCKITYLPPMQRKKNESAVDFANRVKSAIAKSGGFENISWDGQVKRMKPREEWKEKQQRDFVEKLQEK